MKNYFKKGDLVCYTFYPDSKGIVVRPILNKLGDEISYYVYMFKYNKVSLYYDFSLTKLKK